MAIFIRSSYLCLCVAILGTNVFHTCLAESHTLTERDPGGYGYGHSRSSKQQSQNRYDNYITDDKSIPILDLFKAQPQNDQNVADQCFSSNPVRCSSSSKYRTMDGTCNNLRRPWWGSANTAHVRLMRPYYQDGVSQHRLSISDNSELPSARLLNIVFLPDRNVPDLHTRMYLLFSQLVAHDVTLNPQANGDRCCSENGDRVRSTSGVCRPIRIPNNDPFYSRFNRKCLEYKQSAAINCSVGALQPVVRNTHFIDASFVYGSSDAKARSLRSGSRGHLRVRRVNGKEYLPTGNASSCPLAQSRICYDAGDVRVNQHLDLAATQTAMLRFHNYITDRLLEINPHWASNDEILYQEARRIVGAVFQHIVYSEWLPILIGPKYAADVGLAPQQSGYSNAYKPNLNPSTLADFSAGAFRSLHSLIPNYINLVSEGRRVNEQHRFSETLQHPGDFLERGDTLDSSLRGMGAQQQQFQDRFKAEEMSNNFIDSDVPSNANGRFGDSLPAKDIQRGRDFGLRPYVNYRELCGLPSARDFGDLSDYIDSEQISKLSQTYKNVLDIDYYVGGSLESTIAGTLTTPSFRCVLAEAFYRYKYGDRYFYESAQSPGAFSRAQLDTIKRITLSHILCIGGDNIASMQANAFYLPGQDNSLLSCDGLKRSLDLSCFADLSRL